jgi:uncharacterized protein YxjI
MRFQMRQKLLSLADTYNITDADGAAVYCVEGKLISLGKQLSFQDMEQKELAFIRQKLLNWAPTYEIWHQGGLEAVVKKELFTFFHCVFHVQDTPGHDALVAEGNFNDHEYVFSRAGEAVATVSKQWFTIADSYGIEMDDREDIVLVLACAVVIDECCHGDGRRR